MPEADRPRELPARLLTDPEMLHACRIRDFARVFRLVRTRAGIYPSMIARRCELTPSGVDEVIAGRRQLLHMDVVALRVHRPPDRVSRVPPPRPP
jgi:hypothetical protein